MDKKLILDPKEINDWKKNQWNLYASQSINYKGIPMLLRLWINNNGEFRVNFGCRNLYEGTQLTHAIAAWDSV